MCLCLEESIEDEEVVKTQMHAWAVIPSNMYNPQTIQVNIKNNKVKHVCYLYVVIIPLFHF